MHHPSKKQRLTGDDAARSSEALLGVATVGDLSVDVLANILGYLDGPNEIMQKRRVCKKWKEAATKTVVPLTDFRVDSMGKYNAMVVMATEMPNLQRIYLSGLSVNAYGHKWSEGEDPDEVGAADYTTHDIEIISNFSKLRILVIECAGLNGRYPFFFNSFHLLQKLSLQYCSFLKWDLDMLAGLPLLQELECICNKRLTGNINKLRVLKDTLEKVTIKDCARVEGNFMDLAEFPQLKELDLYKTAVTGDIRDIGVNDFTTLENLELPKGVYGGRCYELQSLSDGLDLMRTLYHFTKKRPNLIDSFEHLYWTLIEGSPERYESVDDYEPPFYIHLVQAGSRLGYRWETVDCNPCEVNWLDPEPDSQSSGYEEYIEELQKINSRVGLYRGFHQPPTEEEYSRLHNL